MEKQSEVKYPLASCDGAAAAVIKNNMRKKVRNEKKIKQKQKKKQEQKRLKTQTRSRGEGRESGSREGERVQCPKLPVSNVVSVKTKTHTHTKAKTQAKAK